MKKQKLILFIGCVLGFNLVFWNESQGLNVLIFDLLIFTSFYVIHPKSFKNRNVQILGLSTLGLALNVLFHNSTLSIILHYASLVIFQGFVFQPEMKSILNAIPTGLSNYFLSIKPFRNELVFSEDKNKKSRTSLYRLIRLALIPIVLVVIFFFIFKAANPVFSDLSDDVFKHIEDFFEGFSWARFFFILLSLFVVGGLIFNSGYTKFLDKDLNSCNNILRNKGNRIKRDLRGMVGLKDEYRSGIILMFSINFILVILNIIDINWLWINFDVSTVGSLSQLVHEGTYYLILSILLSMAILLFYFRKNLNFYKENRLLKIGAYAWIAQNLILALSVAIRNYHYIANHGLAYKRIEVIVFLLATIIGLVLLMIKIKEKRSSYYLLRTNAWSVFALLFILSCFNWDVIITKHNLNFPKRGNIDMSFLYDISDKNLHLLHEDIINKPEIYEKGTSNYPYRPCYTCYDYCMMVISDRLDKKKTDIENETWLSWNYSDQAMLDYFEGKELNYYEPEAVVPSEY